MLTCSLADSLKGTSEDAKAKADEKADEHTS
jgi:hypothetical protein